MIEILSAPDHRKILKYEKFKFPVGELHLKLPRDGNPYRVVDISFEYENNEEIIELCLLVNALRQSDYVVNTLELPYIPFSRQDRVMEEGEPFSLKVFADIINSLNFNEVVVCDPHSDVSTALINNCKVLTQSDIFSQLLNTKSDYWLVSPDGGALKKIYKVASQAPYHHGVIECSKLRNTHNGAITGVKVHATNLEGRDCYIVDDICDGGRTFIEIAKELKKLNPGKIVLCVTHGFFTKGLAVFDDLIDEIYTRKGMVK